MLVEIKTPTGWQIAVSDNDWDTTVRWRQKRGSFIAKLSWHTPIDVAAGEYRITHQGQDALSNVFIGISDKIQIN